MLPEIPMCTSVSARHEPGRIVLFWTLVLLCAGCSSSGVTPEQTYDPAKLQGQVDTKLPLDAQERQTALRSVLEQIQRGTDWENLYHPGVTFSETDTAFFEGNIGLESWAFDGAPSGMDVPVTLQLRNNKDELVMKKRRYRVFGTTGDFSVEQAR
jgi:hypothetical protein